MAKCLEKIDFEKESVSSVFIANGDTLNIITSLNKCISVHVKVNEGQRTALIQTDRKWDWVYKLCSQVGDQPVSIEIYENVLSVLFQY